MSNDLDLDKIAEFMNSDVNSEDTEEIEDTLQYIDKQLAEVKKETKDISTPEQAETQKHTIDELTELALKQFNKVDKNSDDLFQLFYGPLATRQDRSDASKVAIVESQRLKIDMINSLASLASAYAKLEAAKQKTGTPGVMINAMTGAEAGLSIKSIWSQFKEDEKN